MKLVASYQPLYPGAKEHGRCRFTLAKKSDEVKNFHTWCLMNAKDCVLCISLIAPNPKFENTSTLNTYLADARCREWSAPYPALPTFPECLRTSICLFFLRSASAETEAPGDIVMLQAILFQILYRCIPVCWLMTEPLSLCWKSVLSPLPTPTVAKKL